MDINNYTLYSQSVQNELMNNIDYHNLVKLMANFEEIFLLDEAKEFLLKNWQIKGDVKDIPIGGDLLLNTYEDDVGLEINFKYADKNITYYYNKQERKRN